MSSPWRIIGEFFIDFFVGMGLILLACILSSTIHHTFIPNLDFLYLVWFTVAMLPFVIYARWREKLNFDLWDVLIYGVVVFTKSLSSHFLPAVFDMALVPIVFAALFQWEAFRSKSFPRTPN